MLEMILLSQS